MYHVYKITNKSNNKIYIGYTGKLVSERFHKHCLNAMSGIDSFLYRAIRKYGASNFTYLVLKSFNEKLDAMAYEVETIEKLNSRDMNVGYNIGRGGSGGWVMGSKSEDEYKIWTHNISLRTIGVNNPNHSGLSDDEIINEAIKYFTHIGYIGGSRVWALYAKEHKLPQSFSKNRFNGSYDVFANIIKEKTGLEIKKHKKSEIHKEHLRKSILGRIWITDGNIDKQIKKQEFKKYKEIGYYKGRTKC